MGSLCLITFPEVLPPERSFSPADMHFFRTGKVNSESGTMLILNIGSIVLSAHNSTILTVCKGNRSIKG